MSKNKQYAGFWIRFGAGTVDSIITLPLFIVMLYLSGNIGILNQIMANPYGFDEGSIKYRKLLDILSYIIGIIYTVFFITSRKQATPGKMMFACYVADKNGNKLTRGRATARFFASMVSLFTLGIGFLIIAFTKEKAALHDFICSTRVYKGKLK